MKFLDYTKKIAEKIRFYDDIAKNAYSNINMTNPFAKPVAVTIVWVEDENY